MIYAPRPFNTRAVCFKIEKGLKQISICCDDSCGALKDLARSDIRCYWGGDVTSDVFNAEEFGGTVRATVETLKMALAWLEE